MKVIATLALCLAGAASQAAVTPQVNALFRVVKPDGQTVIAQVPITAAGSGPIASMTVSQNDALVKANGRCAFNVKYDEVSTVAVTNTNNRLYSNDTLIAQNTKIDMQPNVLRTIWTQPYLFAGQNNVKIVINADSATPTVGWVRINVEGTCGAAPTSTAKPTPPSTPASSPARFIVPGMSEWNALYTAWGYSNYAVTQLRDKGFAGYAGLQGLNAQLAAAVAAQRIEATACAELIARWNALLADPAFRAAMAKVTPSGQK